MNNKRTLNYPEVLLSLATAPLLLSAIAVKSFTEKWQEIGQASEEVFRGDRLPVLPFPEAESDR